jgi:hypothetical protein
LTLARENPAIDRNGPDGNNPAMNPRELQIVSALSVFLSAALPTAVGTVAFRAQPILITLIQGEPGTLPSVTGFFFNHFTAALLTLLALGLIATWVAIKGYRQPDTEGASKMATLLVAVCFSAVASVAFLTLFILSTALPLYARLTDR